MEIDGDDDNQATDKSRPQTKGIKRKRNLLTELQPWGWHSKRKYMKKGKNDSTIEDALSRILPSYLLPEGILESRYDLHDDSMNTMDIYNLHMENNKLSTLPSPCNGSASNGRYIFNNIMQSIFNIVI